MRVKILLRKYKVIFYLTQCKYCVTKSLVEKEESKTRSSSGLHMYVYVEHIWKKITENSGYFYSDTQISITTYNITQYYVNISYVMKNKVI